MKFPMAILSDCCEFLDHARRPIKQSERNGGPYPYFGANGQQGWIDDYLFDEPLVLLAEDGGHFSNPERGIAYKISGKTWVNNHAHVLRPKEGVVTVDYLSHALRNKDVRRYLSGSTRDKLTKAGACQIAIPLPPLDEQRRIAAILDKAHNLKAKVAERADLITALGRSLFCRRFGLPTENPHNLPMHRLVDMCRPKQWPTISSKQLHDHGYPVFGANGLIGYLDRFNHSEPTVLVTCRGATCGTVNISPPNCYVTGNSMAMDDPDPGLLTTDYLAWVLRLRGMHDVISGSAQPQITRQGLEAVTIPVPPIEAQNDFSKELMASSSIGNGSRHSEDFLFELANSLAGALLGGRS